MIAIPRIASFSTEPWVAWTMVVLLCLLMTCFYLQGGVILNAFRGLRITHERGSLINQAITHPIGQLLLWVYKMGIFSLTLYAICMWYHDLTEPYFGAFLMIIGLVVGLVGVKYAICRLLAYVFFTQRIFTVALHHYTGLTTSCAVILYPILLLMFFLPNGGMLAGVILVGIVISEYAIVLILKIFQLFFRDILASVDIFLYLCTLELIPFAILWHFGGVFVTFGS